MTALLVPAATVGTVRLGRAATRSAGTPTRVPARLWRPFDDESVLAVACAEEMVDGELPVPAGGPVLSACWATATAGGPDYAQVCLDTGRYGPGGASPLAGPRSAFNGPAAALSICLGLRGPVHTSTGGLVAGLNALVDGLAPVRAGEVAGTVVGGSASPPVGDDGLPAAGTTAAAAVALTPGAGPGWQVRSAVRTRPAAAAYAGYDLAALLGTLLPPDLPAGSTVLLVDDLPRTALAGRPHRGHTVIRVRRQLGDLGPAAVPAALALLADGRVDAGSGTVALVVLTRARDAGTVVLTQGSAA